MSNKMTVWEANVTDGKIIRLTNYWDDFKLGTGGALDETYYSYERREVPVPYNYRMERQEGSSYENYVVMARDIYHALEVTKLIREG